jgi:predicted phage tail component-like protein
MKTITIDGVEIEEYGFTALLEHDHPFPSTRDKTITIPGRYGEYDLGAELGPRPFSIQLRARKELSMYDLQRRIRQFTKALLDPYGRPKTVKLVFNYEPDKFYYVRYSGSMPIQRLVRFAEFSLPLVAYDPFAYAPFDAYDPKEPMLYDTGLTYDSGLIYPNPSSFQWLYARHYSAVYNHSYYETPLKFIIKGSCTNPKITNMTTGKSITITETLSTNDELIIDASNFTVVKNKTVNLLSKYSGDFIQLVEGTNGFSFESDTVPSATVTFEWYHRFL